MKFNCVDRTISRLFNQLGRLIARHPLYFIIPSFLMSCALSPGLLFLRREIRVTYLFGPDNGRSARDRVEIRSLFPRNESAYDWTRSIEEDPFGTMIAVVEGDGSILSKHNLHKIIEIDTIIKGITVQWNDTTWNYSSLCAINNGNCIEQTALTAIDKILRERQKLIYPLEVYNTYNFLYLGASFGGVVLDDHRMVSAKAIRLIYSLRDHTPAVDLWQQKFVETVEKIHFNGIKVSRISASSISEELGRNSKTVIPLCALAVPLMLLFGMCVCLTQDWVRAKPWIGVAGCVAAGLGVGSALGTLMYAGFPYCDLVAAVPYLMLGIGMDDTFVLLAAWRRTNPSDKVEKRLGETYSEAAVSITITSLTNFVSFLVGLSTPFPVVRIFCTYTAVAVLFSYIYQITFFGGCMALSGYREEKMLHPFTLRKVIPNTDSGKRSVYNVFCSPKYVPATTGDVVYTEFGMMVFMRDYIGDIITKPFAKAIVLLGFAGYLAVALVGCSQIVEGLKYTSIFPYDSYAIPFLQDQGKYFSAYGDRVQVVIKEPIAYWDKDVQNKVEDLLTKFESGRYVAESSLTESWLRLYLNLSKDSSKQFIFGGYDLEDKNGFIDGLHTFLKLPAAKRFHKDIIFNHNGSDIIASRFILQTKDVELSSSEKAMLNYFYDTADESGLPVSMYSHFFPISEQQVLVASTSIQTICIAAAVMMVIFLTFIPNLVCAVCIAFSIVSIEVGVLGFMTLWSVRLDTISMINLIMCIGFSVDYSSHISYVFQTSKLPTSNEKIKWSLYSVGVPIVNGCLSTVLGVVILSFTPSYIFLVFFKIVFLVVVFAALHGMFLLPVLLGIFDSLVSKRQKQSPQVVQEEQTFDILIEKKLNGKSNKEENDDSDRGSCENGESGHSSNGSSENGDER